MSDQLPSAAAQGFEDASAYDAHRPSYPPGAVERFLASLKVTGQPDLKIVEVAAGTGKFTELLAQRPERYLVKAVEPHSGMRQKLADKDLQAVDVVDGTAEKIPVEAEWGDACIAAQAFHWFATPESLKEIHRVLRQGAVLGMIWNIEEYNKPSSWSPTTKWEQKLNDMIWSLDDGLARFRHQKWKEVFEKQLPGSPFQALKNTLSDDLPDFSLPIGEGTEKWTIWLRDDALWSRFNTLSQVAVLKGKQRDDFVSLFKEVLRGDDVERNERGEIAVHGVTYFAWTDRL